MHVHKYRPFDNGTLVLYCVFCGGIKTPEDNSIQTFQDTSPQYHNQAIQNSPELENKPYSPELDNEPSYQDLQAELFRTLQAEESYPIRPEYQNAPTEDYYESDDINDARDIP